MSDKKMVLIDGHSILTRAFFGVPDMTNPEGLHTNAIFGFLNIMWKIMDEEQPDYMAVAFDVKEPTFRHKMFPEYKGTRKPMASELHEQVPLIQEVLKAMQIKVITLAGYEADDILGTMAAKAEKEGFSVVVVSGDRDLLQLAADKTLIRIPKTKKTGTEIENYYAKDVQEAIGVTPSEFIDMKALMGDTSDNIPGVKSIGEKTAAKLIGEYHNLEAIYEHIEEIKPERIKNALIADEENARMSKVLATININSPITVEMDECKIGNIFNPDVYKIFCRLNFQSFLKKFDAGITEECPKLYEEDSLMIVRDLQGLQAFFDALENHSHENMLGYSAYLAESSASVPDTLSEWQMMKQGFGCVVVSLGDRVFLLEQSEELPAEKLCEILVFLDKNKMETAVFDLKSLLKMTPLELNVSKQETVIYDCMVCAYLLNPLAATYEYDVVLNQYASLQVEGRSAVLGKKTMEQMAAEQPERVHQLLIFEACAAQKCGRILKLQLEEQGMLKLYQDLEYPLIFVLDSMEKEGVLIDEQSLKAYGEALSKDIARIEQEIYEETGETFNINSPKQLGVILFEKMGLKGGKKTKTGYSTSADVLEKLAADTPVVHKILEYRQLTKLKSTYADGLCNFISADGRIHGTFNQTITATGRISSTDPNLQNIPIRMDIGKKIREVFIPKEGCVFVDADYSQIELRILAHMSGDEHLIAAYNMEQDIHKITASQVFHVPLDEVTPQLRRNAKAVNFGIVYGISSFGLSEDLSIGKKEAQGYIERYFETYPKVKQFLDETVAFAKKQGYTVTMSGRRRPIPELRSSNFMQRSFGERAAMNSPVQGSAADIMKEAMIRVYRKLKEKQLEAKIVLQVHDELLLEVPLHEVETVNELVKNEMMRAAELSVKLEVGMENGKNWLEAH